MMGQKAREFRYSRTRTWVSAANGCLSDFWWRFLVRNQGGIPTRMSIKIGSLIAAMLALLMVTHTAYAQDSNQAVSSYLPTQFYSDEGLPANIVDDIVQSRDGFLWLRLNGTYLTRFDGRHFTAFSPQPRNVKALASDPNGDLWVGTSTDLERMPASTLNQFEPLPVISYQPGSHRSINITCLRFSRSGVLWVGATDGLYRFEGGAFSSVMPGLYVARIEEASDGHLLVITSKGFMEWDGSQVVSHPELATQLGVKSTEIFDVIEDSHGVVWYCTGKGVARRIGGYVEKLANYGEGHAAFRAYEDPGGNVWFAKSEGLFRATSTGLEVAVAGMNVRYLYGDRDGNLWIGTNGDGLFRFKDRAIRMFTTADGIPNNVVMTVLATRDGGLWTGANCGGLSRFDGYRFRTYNEKDGLLNSCVFALAEDANGDLWVGTYGGGAFRFHGGRFTQYSKPQGLGNDVVLDIMAARDGSLWFATGVGASRMRDGQIRNFTKADGLSGNRVVKLHEDRTGAIWTGTARGIYQMVGDRFVNFSSVPTALAFPAGEDRSGGLYFSMEVEMAVDGGGGIFRLENNRLTHLAPNLEANDVVETEEGNLWFTGSNIFRIPLTGVQRLRSSDEPLDFALFGTADGLTSPEASAGEPNSALTRDGKLWIATPKGLALLDLPHLPITDRKPTIYMEQITVGRNQQFPGHQLSLVAGTHHVELLFDAIEISSPEKTRLQYRLDGVDSEWLDAGPSGRAIYTNIPAGTHAFHIRACNADGIWDRTGMVYSITQQPYFYQTSWFLVVAVIGGLLLLAALYHLRLRQATARLNTRLEERLAERTRIARDLHDTFLQTIQGSKLVVDDALEPSTDPIRMRRAMEQLSVWLGRATQEGRAALNSLRTATTQTNDLAEALLRVTKDNLIPRSMVVTFSLVSEAREMHPIVRDEVYRIAYEAIRNACTHSGASRLEVELRYADDLALRVGDNGAGIDPVIADRGKDGHFGLQGMRERAARIGAKLTLLSSLKSGTEIELIVPGGIIFRNVMPARRSFFTRIRTLFRPKGQTSKLD
jgi:signal transduction histidine kinase/ligand-binding sensor domain-containing protein